MGGDLCSADGYLAEQPWATAASLFRIEDAAPTVLEVLVHRSVAACPLDLDELAEAYVAGVKRQVPYGGDEITAEEAHAQLQAVALLASG